MIEIRVIVKIADCPKQKRGKLRTHRLCIPLPDGLQQCPGVEGLHPLAQPRPDTADQNFPDLSVGQTECHTVIPVLREDALTCRGIGRLCQIAREIEDVPEVFVSGMQGIVCLQLVEPDRDTASGNKNFKFFADIGISVL